MLTLFDGGHSRREFLRIGGLGLGGLTIESLLGAQAASASTGLTNDKSVIFLFLHGGPPQIEMFDPKMTAPVGIRSCTGETQTTLPGVTFGGTLTRLAKLAHRVSVVRSFATGDGRHDIKPVVSKDTLGANLGSLYSRVAGANDPRTGMPTNVALFPRAVNPDAQVNSMNFGKFDATGTLGGAYAPFMPDGNGQFQRDLAMNIPRTRLDDRRQLLSNLDNLKRQIDNHDAVQGLGRLQEQAFDTILGGVSDAFDLSKESPATIARYDTKGLVPRERISTAWNNHKHYVDNVASLGKLLLLARRLCESGCRFVTVTTNFVWDFHADVNNAGVAEGMTYTGGPFDHAVSAFIEDVEARGLTDRILLVACGEFGRTPRLNARGGRDHWGGLAPLLLSGGGLQMGRVIGQSSRDAGEPASDPVTTPNLVSTVMHTLFNVGELRVTRGVPEEIGRLATGNDPIPDLF